MLRQTREQVHAAFLLLSLIQTSYPQLSPPVQDMMLTVDRIILQGGDRNRWMHVRKGPCSTALLHEPPPFAPISGQGQAH